MANICSSGQLVHLRVPCWTVYTCSSWQWNLSYRIREICLVVGFPSIFSLKTGSWSQQPSCWRLISASSALQWITLFTPPVLMAVKPSLKNGAKEVEEVAILKIFWLFMIDVCKFPHRRSSLTLIRPTSENLARAGRGPLGPPLIYLGFGGTKSSKNMFPKRWHKFQLIRPILRKKFPWIPKKWWKLKMYTKSRKHEQKFQIL